MGSIFSRSPTTSLTSSKPTAACVMEKKTSATSSSGERNDSLFPKETGHSLSYWLQCVRANPLLDHRTTENVPGEAEVVIIGSGMSGALTGLKLLEAENPPKSIVMLEARELCSGATGRNAGHCKPDQWRGYSRYEQKVGAEQALKILSNEQATFEALLAYVKTENIDCDLWIGKTLDVATTPEVAKAAAANMERFKAAGGNAEKIEVVTDREEAVKRSRIKSAHAVYAWEAASFYPWKVVSHIVKNALAKGLNLQTWTKVTAVIPGEQEGEWVVNTDRGSVRTPTVVFTTNAYTAALLPEFDGLIIPTPHLCDKLIPPPTSSGTNVLRNTYGVLLPGGALFSINPRSSSDGIVLFGGSNPAQKDFYKYVDDRVKERGKSERCNDGLSGFEPVTNEVRDFVDEQLGWDLATAGPGQGLDYQWSGIIGNSSDGLPIIGPMPGKPGLWMCAAHNGHGMARIFTAAPGLVKLMRGGTWADTRLPECYELNEERLRKLRKLAEVYEDE